ncbi:MAG TPA: hypothetical protein VF599_02685 [Pyrinomonadaceae bacterium]|jgi:hypothetical protein
MNDTEFEKAVAEFIGAFEIVFRYDWVYTKKMIGDEEIGATFIEHGLEDETDNWGARAALLEKYRGLTAVMQKRGIEPLFPFPLERLPDLEQRD